MMVIATEKAPPRLRGHLSLWLVEVRAGLYVGAYGRRARERETRKHIGKGNAVVAWSAQNECGFAFDVVGQNQRAPVEIDGMNLARLLELVRPRAAA
jgi:CRISPR-associated protein Cas2